MTRAGALSILLFVSAAPAFAGPTSSPSGAGTRWNRAAAGLEFRVMDGGPLCRRGSRAVAVVRFEPSRWRIEPFSLMEDPNGREGLARDPLDIEGWRKRTGAAVVFNAGQYYPDRTPMGLFVKEGRNLGSPQIKAWKGLLVAEPAGASRGRGRTPRATLLDLEHDRFALTTTPYRVVVQSFMLLDRDGKKRVRHSDWLANRTVVAMDRRGRLLVLHTEGGWSLWDFADWISRSGLGVRQAMAMDGGFESQISVRSGATVYLSYGQWHIDDRGDRSMPGLKVGLPLVIALFPRK